MKSQKFAPIIFMLFSISLILTLSSLSDTTNVQGYKGIDPVIIFDVAHEQRFNDTHLQSALQLIETEFEAEIHINKENFTLTNLRGADLLILPAPYIDATRSRFSDLEKRAITEFYQDGGSILYLANPYFFEEEMRNYSSNLQYINDMMGISIQEGEDTYGSLSFNTGEIVLLDDFNNLYSDERFIHITNETIDTTHPIINGLPDEDPIEELIFHTNYIIRSSDPDVNFIVNTSRTAYELNSNGEVPFGGGTSKYTILASEEIIPYNSKAISCASAIMFSDLEIIENDTITWFESFDNAKLWKNMIAWLLKDLPIQETWSKIPDFGLFAIILVAIFFVFIVLGSILFTIGREIKKAEVSDTIIKMRDREDDKKKIDKEIEEAYFAEDVVEKEAEEEKEKEVDMKRISDEVKKKPPKTRTRSERRRKV
ncbi:MAG: hypothetical protein FK731_00705 [Asgard group archaeon]|nr:hypothetical protein [Asgard group archaeon]